MNEQIISEKEVSKALDYLRDSAAEVAKAKAERIYLEEYRKSLKALIMKDHLDISVSTQVREAYASDEQVIHLRAMQVTIERYET